MRRIHKTPDPVRHSKNFSISETPKAPKPIDSTTPLSSKSTSSFSKYSIFKNIYQQRILAQKLESHGPSIVYNFKYRNIMQQPQQLNTLEDSNVLPDTTNSEYLITRKGMPKIGLTENTEENSFSQQDEPISINSISSSTSHLKARIFKFLKRGSNGNCQRALDAVVGEITTYKEKHRQHRDNIYKALQITESAVMNQKLVDLNMQNIRKNIVVVRNIEAPEESQPPGSPLIRTKSRPTTKSLSYQAGGGRNNRTTTFTQAMLSTDYGYMPKNNTSVETPKKLHSISLRPSSTQVIHRPTVKVETNVTPVANLRPEQLSRMIETSRKILEKKLSSIRYETPKSEKTPVTTSIATSSPKVKSHPKLKRSPWVLSRSIQWRFIDVVKKLVKKMQLLGLSAAQIFSGEVFPEKAYQRKEAISLIRDTKIGDYYSVKKYLKENRYLVYDYDPMKQTALHWAVKRGQPKIAKLLLENGADPDARDVNGRTPLFLAAKENSLLCLKLLLFYRANPHIRTIGNMRAIDVVKMKPMRQLLKRYHRIYLVLDLCSPFKYKSTWDRQDKRDFEVRDADLE